MILATAGHVDHGKTSLVRALTGVETDRLPEERARGMSIDLGFAYATTPAGQLFGLVDVPGHERFIRNMACGVGGLDGAVLVVAADDGPMPQTHEHLRILEWLGVPIRAVAITKADRVDARRLEGVGVELAALLGPSVSTFRVSSTAGHGVRELREHLFRLADDWQGRVASGRSRLAIDRAFLREGHGLVVTGTLYSGTIRRGDTLVVSPSGEEVRVRGLQVAGRDVAQASAGQRCAVNIAGPGTSGRRVERGDWLLDPRLLEPTQLLDVSMTLRCGDGELPRPGAKVQVHAGAAVVDATLHYRSGSTQAQRIDASLRLARPLYILRGDRFILRDRNGTRTVGGGAVVDPFPPPRERHAGGETLKDVPLEASPTRALLRITAADCASVDLDCFEVAFNLPDEEAVSIYEATGTVVLEGPGARLGIGSEAAARHREAVRSAVSLHHVRAPEAPGLPLASLRKALGSALPAAALADLARRMAGAGELEIVGASVRLPGFRELVPADEIALRESAVRLLDDAGHGPWRQKDLAAALKVDEARIARLLGRLAAHGAVLRIADRVFAGIPVVRALAEKASALGQDPGSRFFTAAAYRDATGLNRRTAIQLLEYFDQVRLTLRKGEERRMLRTVQEVFGTRWAHVA